MAVSITVENDLSLLPLRITDMVSTAYIAASANRFSHVSDSSSRSLVAFGSSKFVALWSANVRLDLSARHR